MRFSVNTLFGDSARDENQAIRANLSNPRNVKELLEEYQREYDRAVEGLLLSCFHTTEQGVLKIKEL